MPDHNVIAYIDGFNLYYGLRRKGWRWAYWLNLQKLMQLFLDTGQELVHTKYFTSIISNPPDKHKRQATFLEALGTLPNFSIQFGHYMSDLVTCRKCGHMYNDHHEKKTDVNIATSMLVDAFEDRFNTAFLVTADSDLLAPIRVIKQLFPSKRVIALFPPGRSSKELRRSASGYQHIGEDKLSKSLFPEEIEKPDGYVLTRPERWR